MFKIKIATDNAVFHDDEGKPYAGPEVARILRLVAKLVEGGMDDGPIRDINGNTVGSFELTED